MQLIQTYSLQMVVYFNFVTILYLYRLFVVVWIHCNWKTTKLPLNIYLNTVTSVRRRVPTLQHNAFWPIILLECLICFVVYFTYVSRCFCGRMVTVDTVYCCDLLKNAHWMASWTRFRKKNIEKCTVNMNILCNSWPAFNDSKSFFSFPGIFSRLFAQFQVVDLFFCRFFSKNLFIEYLTLHHTPQTPMTHCDLNRVDLFQFLHTSNISTMLFLNIQMLPLFFVILFCFNNSIFIIVL